MLLYAGLSHGCAPLHLRERCAVPTDDRERVTADLRRRFAHVVLLSTCGRVELYIDDPNPEAAEQAAVAWLAARAGLTPTAMAAHVETGRDADAARRAVRVACGLESAVQGEDEILGQVRRAWLDAGSARALSPALDTTFRLAVRTGRQARRIGDPHAWTSLADTAAAHVASAIGRLPAPRVLIAGSGPMGLRAARWLRGRFGLEMELTLAGRTPERVAAHAAALDARPLDLAGIPAALDRADAAVVGLRTRATVIAAGHLAPRPPDRPLMLVDLSVPRAVDAAVARLPGVTFRDVDDLGDGDGGHTRWDAGGRGDVQRLVERAVQDFGARTERTDAAATLAALRIQADGIRRRQLAHTLRRLPHLDDEARWAIDALTRSIVNRLLHDPTMRLKADTSGDAVRHIHEMFLEPPRNVPM